MSCDKAVSATATFCEHCGAPQARNAHPENLKKSLAPKMIIGIMATVLVGIVWCGTNIEQARINRGESAAFLPPALEQTQTKRLALLASRAYQSSSYYIVEGQVKNISGTAIKNIEAVATWYDKDDTFIASDSSLIEYRPLMPGQSSPFKVMTSRNPLMQGYRMEFKEFSGAAIPFDDLSNSKSKKKR